MRVRQRVTASRTISFARPFTSSCRAARRGQLHARIGQALEAMYGTSSDSHLAELAFHFSQAAAARRRRDEPSSADDVRATSDRVFAPSRRSGHRITCLRGRAAGCSRWHWPLSIPSRARAERAGLLLAIGEAEALAGRLDRARESLLEAADIARDEHLPLIFARAALSYGGRHQWTRAGFDTLLIPMLEESIAMLGSSDDQNASPTSRPACRAWRGYPSRFGDCERLESRSSRPGADTERRLDACVRVDRALLGNVVAGQSRSEREVAGGRDRRGWRRPLGDGELWPRRVSCAFLNLFEQGRLSEARRAVNELVEVVRADATTGASLARACQSCRTRAF